MRLPCPVSGLYQIVDCSRSLVTRKDPDDVRVGLGNWAGRQDCIIVTIVTISQSVSQSIKTTSLQRACMQGLSVLQPVSSRWFDALSVRRCRALFLRLCLVGRLSLLGTPVNTHTHTFEGSSLSAARVAR